MIVQISSINLMAIIFVPFDYSKVSEKIATLVPTTQTHTDITVRLFLLVYQHLIACLSFL